MLSLLKIFEDLSKGHDRFANCNFRRKAGNEMIYNEETVMSCFEKNRRIACEKLSSLDVAEGRIPNEKLVSGWVFEQVIRYFLIQELKELGKSPVVKKQEKIIGRAKLDLLVGKVAIEIKSSGSFNLKNDIDKYTRYKDIIKDREQIYIYLVGSETSARYLFEMERVFGKGKAFFLRQRKGDWERFVTEVLKNLE